MTNQNNKINQILMNARFKEHVRKNAASEQHRKFCRHGLEHSLDVARIAYIINLEQGLGFSKDVIYGTALLHDIGKWQEYREHVPHDLASAALAREILSECEFTAAEAAEIEAAILQHRTEARDESSLHQLLYYADKKSRNCFNCAAKEECYWQEEKRNYQILY
ncbi:MAG: HD domain-containing protein [Pelosinus sp.]|nr:HD domain-containing protein [Pelosinus sp.]